MAIFPNEQAVDTLYVMAKASFSLGEKWRLADEALPFCQADIFYGEPDSSSLRYSSDFHPGKLGTDVYMLGSACAPDQQKVRALDVKLKLGNVEKTVRVMGDRYWDGMQISAPEPFETMRMRHENAFGGSLQLVEQAPAVNVFNPVGKGWMAVELSKRGEFKSTLAKGEAIYLPNLELPSALIVKPEDNPAPACFAPIARHWQPRSQFAGSYDESWQQTRAPYLPLDYSTEFMNCAQSDLVFKQGLQGGESVDIEGMHPAGPLSFDLPQLNLECAVKLKNQIFKPKFFLETVVLEPNLLNVTLVWRAAFACDKSALQIENVEIDLVNRRSAAA